MCGICGIMRIDGRTVEPAALDAMGAAMKRRGPDDAGTFIRPRGDALGSGAGVGLGQQRLSIIDLSPAGRQPMSNEDGTIWLTFNGEIYNYKELRRELEAKGHRFRSESDTEVVIHLYEEEGLEAVKRFNGMFAFGLWDENKTASLALPRPGGHQAAGLLLGRRSPAVRLGNQGASHRSDGR